MNLKASSDNINSRIYQLVSLVTCHKPGYNSRTMHIASGPSLVVEDVPSGSELCAMTLRMQAQARHTGMRVELNQIDQILEKSRHK